jgi:hypothetical protein
MSHYSKTIKVISFSYMRNGVGGTGFYTILFKSPDNPKTPMLALSFESAEDSTRDGDIAIFDVNLLKKGRILFPDNHFSYDFFYKEIRRVISEYEQAGYKEQKQSYTPSNAADWAKMINRPVRD